MPFFDIINILLLIIHYVFHRYRRLCFPLEAAPSDVDVDSFIDVYKVNIMNGGKDFRYIQILSKILGPF